MKIDEIYCKSYKNLLLEELDISILFSNYQKIYLDTFKLSDKDFLLIKDFKEKRTGFLYTLSKDKKNFAMFTFTNGINNHLELGDVMKLKEDLPRETFASALKKASNFALKTYSKDTIYGYPNPRAVSLEKMAGYREIYKYTRRISLVLFNITFLLPVIKFQGKLKIMRDYFKSAIMRKNLKLSPTRLSFLGIKIYKKTNQNNSFHIKLGFLYEFFPSKDYGDLLLVFGNREFKQEEIGFEFSDNSV